MTITQIPAHTNNYGVGRGGKTPNKVIVHWIVGSLASADATFKSPTRLASAHYGIEDGKVHQYVKETDTAWHASNLTVNRESIGIEHSGGELLAGSTTQRRKPSDQTHETSGKLIGEICKRYGIPIDKDHILPHNKFSSTQCPGTLDIDKLISIARQQVAPTPTNPVLTDQTRIPQIENLEIQAIRSVYYDRARIIDEQKAQLLTFKNHNKELENKVTELSIEIEILKAQKPKPPVVIEIPTTGSGASSDSNLIDLNTLPSWLAGIVRFFAKR